jgi:hypothetical protein
MPAAVREEQPTNSIPVLILKELDHIQIGHGQILGVLVTPLKGGVLCWQLVPLLAGDLASLAPNAF